MRQVIIGSGVAGITAAIELSRRQNGPIEVYTAERHPYYFRPRLTHLLAGEISPEEMYIRPLSWYEERGIQVYLDAPVVRLLPAEGEVLLADGRAVPYDRLLLATGSTPFVPPFAGTDQAGVFTLRTLEDALAIRDHAARCQEAVVIGGGLLGLETARALQVLGLAVTVLQNGPRLLPRQLDEEGAGLFQRLVEELGVHVLLDASTEAILGSGQARGVRLEDGREVPAQVVVIATGVRSRVELAQEAGLEVSGGIVVDEHLATSAPHVYAAGDAAIFEGRCWGIIPVAQAQARVAAANMAGEESRYEEKPPATTLHIVGIDLTSVGRAVAAEAGLTTVRHLDAEAGIYRKIVLAGDLPVGAIVIGDRPLAQKLERLLADGVRMTPPEALALVQG